MRTLLLVLSLATTIALPSESIGKEPSGAVVRLSLCRLNASRPTPQPIAIFGLVSSDGIEHTIVYDEHCPHKGVPFSFDKARDTDNGKVLFDAIYSLPRFGTQGKRIEIVAKGRLIRDRHFTRGYYFDADEILEIQVTNAG